MNDLGQDLNAKRLFGRWYGKHDGDPMALDFAPDGRLACVILHGSKRQTIMLTYRVDGDELITDQLSSPREERTKVEFDGSDVIFEFQGRRTRFTR